MPLPTRLLEGYRSFRAGRYSAEADRYQHLAEGQTPAVMIVACCDSGRLRKRFSTPARANFSLSATWPTSSRPTPRTAATMPPARRSSLPYSRWRAPYRDHGPRALRRHRAAASETSPLSHTDFIGSWTAPDQGRHPRRAARRGNRRSRARARDRARLDRALAGEPSDVPMGAYARTGRRPDHAWCLVRYRAGRTARLRARRPAPGCRSGRRSACDQSDPRLTAAMPVRHTSTRPSGAMIAMNCSILDVRPVTSKTK